MSYNMLLPTARRHAGRTLPTFLAAAGLVSATLWAARPGAAQSYDLVIRGGTLVDGSGGPARAGDVAIDGGRIAAVGELGAASADRAIDATGLHIFPGFIDTHSHAMPALLRDQLRTARPLLAQGITTIFANPDGGGTVDLAEQRARIRDPGVGVNVGAFVPHGSVRRAVLGLQAREATPEELDRMRTIVRDGMGGGAFGLSSGLYYSPGSYAPTGEVVELAKIAAEYGGVYQSHIRDESDYSIGLIGAVDEVIEISRGSGITGVVTHIKALGPRVWGQSADVVRRIEAARAEGLAIYADQYPYEASGTSIVGALVPRWALAGAGGNLYERMEDPAERPRLVAEMWENLDRRGGADRLMLQGGPDGGRTLQDVADDRGMDAIETALALLVEALDGGGGTGLTSFNMNDEDIARFMSQPWMMTSSDGSLWVPGEGHPHPRGFGAFPRRIRKYVLEEGVTTLEQAIHAMTALPARVYGIEGRGVLAPGAVADVIVVDLERFRDTAEYGDPHGLAEGVEYSLVNGTLAIDEGRFTDALAGEAIVKTQ
ncbi:MAG: amidohydrolase family protein [Gemmatimonadales bacterium]|nr:amidohydrolase family protein [Gemmatimonadales bacterium]MYG49160.1 amidohydrolase family protein [Gemmatimonadales bacterium]MYK00946.1 amidohydrolase family protein [Candidatus Palauibacter ramosifaciens]